MGSTTVPPSSASSPADPAGAGADRLALLADLADPARRRDAALALARSLGADDLVIFTPDPEVGALLPAPGFPQTLPGGAAWQALLRAAAERGTAAGAVSPPGGAATVESVALAGRDGSVLVLLGAAAGGQADWLRALLPLLANAFRGEREAATAAGQAAVARAAAAQAEALALSLDKVRRDLGDALARARGAADENTRLLAELRRHHALLEAVLDSTTDAVFVKDADGGYLLANRALSELVRLAAGEIVGRTDADLFPGVTAAQLASVREDDRKAGALPGGQFLRFEEAVETPAGRRHFLTTKAPYRDAGGRALGVIGIARDITDRKAAEDALREYQARLEAVLHGSTAVIYVKDTAGRYAMVNRHFERVFGLAEAELVGRTDHDLFPREVADRFAANDRRVLEAGRPVEFEEDAPHPDGTVHSYISAKFPLRDAAGAPTGVCGVSTDITDRKRAEAALREADRRKDEFLAMLAHELRNPLGPIRNAAQVLRLVGPPDPRAAAAREMIERQAAHMARLVDDLLDVSRIARGKAQLRKERVDLARVVRQTAEDYRGTIEGAGLALAVSVPAGPVWAHGDPTRLAQVVSNVLHNAHKFTDPGGSVTVTLAAEGGSVAVSVRDTGIGMDRETLGRVFEPFSQADRSLDRSRGGLGLGLALVRGLVELHGGTVAAESPGLGLGTTVVIRLPAERPGGATAGPGDRTPAAPTRGHRVLVVEDNADAAESMRMLLELTGHAVEVARSGADGVSAARAFRPDVVLCDIGLPGGMDGYQVAGALRGDPASAGAYLVALSGYGQEEDRRRGRQAGFDAHLVKPVDFDALQRLLQSLPAAP